jgi:hypothetical protein
MASPQVLLDHRLLSIPIEAGTTQSGIELHSGIARHYPRIYGNLVTDRGAVGEAGIIIVHPMSNFLGHHLLEPIARSGTPVIGLNTRYAGNDAAVILENCLVDIAAAVRWARDELRWKRVVLCGFSGGGPLAAYYQRQAEAPSVRSTPAGDPPDFTRSPLPPADAVLLIASSKSRSHILQSWIDPSVTDELDPDSCDPSLDLYAEGRSVPYDRAWLEQYRAAQMRRMMKIDNWVVAELARLGKRGIRDRAFVVHRTVADPRLVDMTLEPSERAPGSIYGDPRQANQATGPMGRYSSLRSWLSVWSPVHSNGDALKNLAHVRRPVAIMSLTADQGSLVTDGWALRDAAPGCRFNELKGYNHYFLNQPDDADVAVGHIGRWMKDTVLA